MADDPKPDDPNPPKPDDPKDPDAGAKAALDSERKARRDAEKAAADLRAKLKDLEDKDKTDSERLTSRVAELEKSLATETARADRYEVALEKGLDMVRAKRLAGATREEIEADADELKSWSPGEQTPPASPGKPTESLKGGGDPTQEPEVNVREVVDSIPRGF